MIAWIVAVILKATLLLLGVGIVALLARRAPAATRHFVWSTGLALLLLLPALALSLPAWSPNWADDWVPHYLVARGGEDNSLATWLWVPRDDVAGRALPGVVAGAEFDSTEVATGKTEAAPAEPSGAPLAAIPLADVVARWLMAVWSIGALAMALWLAVGFARRARLARQATVLHRGAIADAGRDVARRLGVQRPITILLGQARFVPMTWGVTRPVLYLPAAARSWAPERLRSVLLHELAHIKRNDSLSRVLAQLACSVFWFHPLAWAAARRMLREQERACDDAVIVAGADPHDYAAMLVQMVREFRAPRPLVVGALAFSRRSNLEHRLLSILDPLERRKNMSTFRKALVAVLFVAAVLPLAALRPAVAMQEQSESIRLEASGANRIPADVDRISLEPDGSLVLEQGNRRLEVRSAGADELAFVFTVGGVERAFDDNARRWANGALESLGELRNLRGDFLASTDGRRAVLRLEPLELRLQEAFDSQELELQALALELPELDLVLPKLELQLQALEALELPELELQVHAVERLEPPVAWTLELLEPLELQISELEPSMEALTLTLDNIETTLAPLELQLDDMEARLEVIAPSLRLALQPQLGTLDMTLRTGARGAGVFDSLVSWTEDGARTVVMQNGEVEIGSSINDLKIGEDGDLVIDERAADGARQRLHVYPGDDGELVFDWWVDGEETPFDDAARAWLRPILERLR